MEEGWRGGMEGWVEGEGRRGWGGVGSVSPDSSCTFLFLAPASNSKRTISTWPLEQARVRAVLVDMSGQQQTYNLGYGPRGLAGMVLQVCVGASVQQQPYNVDVAIGTCEPDDWMGSSWHGSADSRYVWDSAAAARPLLFWSARMRWKQY